MGGQESALPKAFACTTCRGFLRGHLVQPVTQHIAEWVVAFEGAKLRRETIERAKHAVLDWVGVAIAGANEPLVNILTEDAIANGESGHSTLVGRSETVSPTTAALINGAASHALDFDDVNQAMRGHPSVAVLPAVFALTEQHNKSGRQALECFIVGYQIACAMGEMMGPSHYETGWHNTATVGTLGAAAGASKLLGLSATQCAHALGNASTQAAGLKAMFGTMCKPLHAGKAASSGLLSARWAARGFTSNPNGIEAHQGFAHTQSNTFASRELPAGAESALAIEAGLYKYHAACYLTHACIEATKELVREHKLTPKAVGSVCLTVQPSHQDVCDILVPASGLEVKFSIRHLVAMAISGVDTTDLSTYNDVVARRSDLLELARRVNVAPETMPSRHIARVEVTTTDGTRYQALGDVSVPMSDTAQQWTRLEEKFRRLVAPRIGTPRTDLIVEMVARFEVLADVTELTEAARG